MSDIIELKGQVQDYWYCAKMFYWFRNRILIYILLLKESVHSIHAWTMTQI